MRKRSKGRNTRREHFRSDGKPKIGLEESEARQIAERLSVEYSHKRNYYICGLCGKWHTGRQRSLSRTSQRNTLIEELGPRAFHCMSKENNPNRIIRLKHIVHIAYAAMNRREKEQ